MFAALWIAPDLSMLGYLKRPCLGARWYNAAHTYVLPGILALCAVLLHARGLLPFALIWVNHIGVDRLLGVRIEVLGRIWIHAPGQIGKTRGYFAGSELTSTPGRKARATSDAPKKMRMMQPARARS